MDPLPTMNLSSSIVDVYKPITQKPRDDTGDTECSLPVCRNHGLLFFAIPLDGDGHQARSESSLEHSKEESDRPHARDILGESKGEDELIE